MSKPSTDLRNLRALLGAVLLVALALFAPASACATTVIPPEFTTLVNDSDYIVHAVVRSVTAEKRATANGSQIFTRVNLEILEVIAGSPPATVSLEMLGGRVGGDELRVEGMPVFHEGDEDILFVSGNGRALCPLYAMMHGRYRVLKDAATGSKYVARSDMVPLRSTAEISQPVLAGSVAELQRQRVAPSAAFTPAAFVGAIRAGINPNSRLKHAP